MLKKTHPLDGGYRTEYAGDLEQVAAALRAGTSYIGTWYAERAYRDGFHVCGLIVSELLHTILSDKGLSVYKAIAALRAFWHVHVRP